MDKIEYSLVIFDQRDKVFKIASKYGVKLEKRDFCGEDGFSFAVEENAYMSHPLVVELNQLSTVYLFRRYAVISKEMQEK